MRRHSARRRLRLPTVALATVVAAASWGALGAQGPAQPVPDAVAASPWSARLERFLHNPRERTDDAVEAYRSQRFEQALPPAHEARKLAPEEPLTGYNSGTLELAAGLPEDAIATFEETLEALRAPESAIGLEPTANRPPESRYRRPALAASTLYNLGNARLAQQDPAGAIEAYEETLRLAPDHADAKFNLELALRELEKQNPPPQPQQQPQEGEGEGEPPPEPQPGSENGEQQEQPGEGQGPDESPRDPRPEDSRLQEFEDQPDMTAEEAAAILEAVESLERQQRREEAAERTRNAATRGEKDW